MAQKYDRSLLETIAILSEMTWRSPDNIDFFEECNRAGYGEGDLRRGSNSAAF